MPLRTYAEQLKAEVERRLAAPAPDSAPPDALPTYPHVSYRDGDTGREFTLPSIAYKRVLDIGVGHVHHHERDRQCNRAARRAVPARVPLVGARVRRRR